MSFFRFYLLFSICFMLFFASYAQNSRELDSLEKKLKVPHHDTIIVQLNNKLCWENRLINFAKAMNYGEKALKLGRKINYQKGILKSLSFLGVTFEQSQKFYRCYSSLCSEFDTDIYYLFNLSF